MSRQRWLRPTTVSKPEPRAAGNPTGSVLILHLATNRVVTRDQFKVLPMPDLVVVEYLTATARKEGYTRAAVDPGIVYFPDPI